jgi:hypothetical protein
VTERLTERLALGLKLFAGVAVLVPGLRKLGEPTVSNHDLRYEFSRPRMHHGTPIHFFPLLATAIDSL